VPAFSDDKIILTFEDGPNGIHDASATSMSYERTIDRIKFRL
jgi:hypothetical protein